ncbi:hypothetical protein OK016_19685 [Vibrio chagasii]|nr:hypothetical protein [Vibrio chagasii]
MLVLAEQLTARLQRKSRLQHQFDFIFNDGAMSKSGNLSQFDID